MTDQDTIWARILYNFTTPFQQPKPPAIPPTHKVCIDCKEMLLMESFYSRGRGNSRTARCKKCYARHQNATYPKPKLHGESNGKLQSSAA